MWTELLNTFNPDEETAKIIAKKRDEVIEARDRLCACCKKHKCKRCILNDPFKQFDISI